MPFLPISKADMQERGIDTLDFICITGDSYVDHPSFGISIISRMIEDKGVYRENSETVGLHEPLYERYCQISRNSRHCHAYQQGNDAYAHIGAAHVEELGKSACQYNGNA